MPLGRHAKMRSTAVGPLVLALTPLLAGSIMLLGKPDTNTEFAAPIAAE
jgi:hypothetical protein